MVSENRMRISGIRSGRRRRQYSVDDIGRQTFLNCAAVIALKHYDMHSGDIVGLIVSNLCLWHA
jgi:hypothetical protein